MILSTGNLKYIETDIRLKKINILVILKYGSNASYFYQFKELPIISFNT